jgi:hypothetical protein
MSLTITMRNHEADRRGKFVTPVRVYRVDGGYLATEPDSSGKSYLAYSVDKIVTDEADIKAITSLVNPVVKEVEAPTNKDASTPPANKAATKTRVRRKRTTK